MTPTVMRVLSEKDVRHLLDMDELIRALERAHIEFSTGKAVMPVRLVAQLPQVKGRITSMPGYLGETGALGVKVITFFQENPGRGLPAILATIHLYDIETGKLIAVMDGTYTTAMRTAGASAMATKALARKETPVLGVLGAGVQAAAHIRALCRVRAIHEINVFSPSGKSAERLKVELASEIGVRVAPVARAEDAVRGADLLVTATTAKEPVIDAGWLKPGVHINAIGAHRPDYREIDAATMKRAKLFVESREASMAECGEMLLALKEGAITEAQASVEIGEVLAGKKAGRTSEEEITLYKSVGIAIQDVAAAYLVYRKALERKVGVDVEI